MNFLVVLGAPRAYHGGEHHAVQTVNDLPVPEGDWQEHNNAKNRTYNGVLAAGIVAFGVTLTLVSFKTFFKFKGFNYKYFFYFYFRPSTVD